MFDQMTSKAFCFLLLLRKKEQTSFVNIPFKSFIFVFFIVTDIGET